MEEGRSTNFCSFLVRFYDVIKLQSFEFSVSEVIPTNAQNISPLVFFVFFVSFFVRFLEKKPPIKFYGVFDHFSRTYEVAKFWMIELYLNVSDIMNANSHTKHANCGLRVNFWNFLLMYFCFMMEKDHFKQKLLLWPQVFFNFSVIFPYRVS